MALAVTAAATPAQACDDREVRLEIAVPSDNIVPMPLAWRIESTCTTGGLSCQSGTLPGTNTPSLTLPGNVSANDKCRMLRDDIASRCTLAPSTFIIAVDGCANNPPSLTIRDNIASCPAGQGVALGISNDNNINNNVSGFIPDYELDLIYPGCGMANYCLLKGSATGTRIVPGSPAADVAAIVDLRPIGGPEVVARETTTAGQTPADLAARLVADLNGNSALSSRGVHCRTRGNLPDNQRAVICTQPLGVPVDAGTGGAIAVACQPNDTGVAKANEAGTQAVVDTALTKVDNPVNDSTGCSSFSACNVLPPVAPALPPWALGLLGGSLLAGAVIVLRRRSQLFRPV